MNPGSPLPFLPEHKSLRIRSLDGLRGVAILLVLGFHTCTRWHDLLPWIGNWQDLYLFKFGFLGVELFFLISGFVIYMTLEKCQTLSEFLCRRWLRLFPAMLIATLLIYFTALLLPHRPNGALRLIDIFPGLLLIDPDLLNKLTRYHFQIKAIEGDFWSLFVEVKFYLIFGALYFYRKHTALRNLIVLFLLAFSYAAAEKFWPALADPIVEEILFHLLSLQYFGWFCIGALLYRAYHVNSSQATWGSALLMVPATVLIAGQDIPLILACAVIYALFYLALNHRQTASILRSPLMLLAGMISYPFYLIHENAMVALTITVHRLLPSLPDAITPWPGIVLLALIAFDIAVYLEPRLGSALKARLPFQAAAT